MEPKIKPFGGKNYWENASRAHHHTPCAVCGKEIKNEDAAHWMVVVDGGASWGDENSDVNDPGYMGGWPIGADCWRKYFAEPRGGKKMEPKAVYFLQETELAENGGYIPCIAVEGEHGFHRTDWNWGADRELAQKICDEKNLAMGIEPREAMLIQLGTMRPL